MTTPQKAWTFLIVAPVLFVLATVTKGFFMGFGLAVWWWMFGGMYQ